MSRPKPSLFALLAEQDGGDDDDDDAGNLDSSTEEEHRHVENAPLATTPPLRKSKKKKKKGKGKATATGPGSATPWTSTHPDMDEIDRALAALNTTARENHGHETLGHDPAVAEEMQQLFSALAIDKNHLRAENEMRKLFGRAALHADDNEHAGARNQQGRVAGAVAGRNAPGQRSLASLGLRRNIFVRSEERRVGKECPV